MAPISLCQSENSALCRASFRVSHLRERPQIEIKFNQNPICFVKIILSAAQNENQSIARNIIGRTHSCCCRYFWTLGRLCYSIFEKKKFQGGRGSFRKITGSSISENSFQTEALLAPTLDYGTSSQSSEMR